jgi:hypothetical protein
LTRRLEKPTGGSNGRRDQAIRDSEIETAEARSETIDVRK